MNFPTYQADARSTTAKLVILGLLGLLGLIAAMSALTIGIMWWGLELFRPWTAVAIAAPLTIVTVFSIAAGKSYLVRSGGGAYVARSLGGRQIDFTTRDVRDKQLANIVEEIAIASGTPAPAVFVLDAEPGINAFAAGWTIDSSAIGVTRGALQHLSRNELQGIVAHEFSHIINGDTRTKTRMIGWVFGITAIYSIGRLTFDGGVRSGHLITAVIGMGVGMGLAGIGFVGSIFARMIQAGVSRQREYLADATAVQYTRDPEGIGEALKKTGGLAEHGRLVATFGTETNHLFFVSAFGGLMATHPSLKRRIRRLLPDWDGAFSGPSETQISGMAAYVGRGGWRDILPAPEGVRGIQDVILFPLGPAVLDGASRTPTPGGDTRLRSDRFQPPSFSGPTDEHIAHARDLIEQIPEATRDYLHTEIGAVASIIGLLVSPAGASRDQELVNAGQISGLDPCYIGQAGAVIGSLGRPLQLPAIDMALTAIRETTPSFRRDLAKTIRAVDGARPDKDLFRWMLRQVVLRHIDDQYDDAAIVHRMRFDRLHVEASMLFAVVAWFNSSGVDDAQHAYDAAHAATQMPTVLIPAITSLDGNRIDDALDSLAQLDRTGRERLVLGATAAVLHDDTTTADEAELIRVIADAVRLPVPPLLVG